MIRVLVRVVINPPFGHDDRIILAATVGNPRLHLVQQLIEAKVSATIQSCVLLYGVSKGLGKSADLISPTDLLAAQKVDHQHYSLHALMKIIRLGRLRQ